MTVHLRLAVLIMAAALWGMPARAADSYFVTSDGVRLHVIDAGPRQANPIVLVPGWTMPAWIFQAQITALSRTHRVLALDPRGQGDSDIAESGYDHLRRGQDIAELIGNLGTQPVVLVGWSLGVLDSLAYVQQYGDRRLAGLVLVDNSIGEDPAPVPSRTPPRSGPRLAREEQMRRFVQGMFSRPPGAAYLAQLTEYTLRTPPDVAAQLLSYPAPRTYWRDAVYSVTKPVLYVVRPRFAAQAGNLQAKHPMAKTVVFETAGHALFVDEPARFNALLLDFMRQVAGS